MDWTGLNYNGMDWIGLDYNGMDWIGMESIGYFCNLQCVLHAPNLKCLNLVFLFVLIGVAFVAVRSEFN